MTRQPQEPEPHHRQWLHALEDDRTVPGTAMQVARIFADYAASKGGRQATVPVKTLRHQTHRSNDALDDAIGYLVDQGWLTPLPNNDGQPRKNGQRKPYALTSGVPGAKREAFRQPERSASQNPFRLSERFADEAFRQPERFRESRPFR